MMVQEPSVVSGTSNWDKRSLGITPWQTQLGAHHRIWGCSGPLLHTGGHQC